MSDPSEFATPSPRRGAPARATSGSRPLGTITRGTTNPNRLRRADRWLAGPHAWRLRGADHPLVVDLGYGSQPYTTAELFERLRRVRADVQVLGLEIDPERVRAASSWAEGPLSFALGGFEIPTAQRPVFVRAFNVLRQYPEDEVTAVWATIRARLAPNGLLIDGTCDEIGRRATWVAVDASGPISLTISTRWSDLHKPSDVAARLPKALIHHNTPKEPVGRYLHDLDRAWRHQAAQAGFGSRQRWIAMAQEVKTMGWPILDGPQRHRLGEISVAWEAVRP